MQNEFRDPQQGPERPSVQAEAPSSPSQAAPLALPSDAIALIPVRNLVLFPGLVAPISVGRESSVRAAQDAARANRQVGIILQRDPETEDLQRGDLHEVGTVANIVRYMTGSEGSHHVICQGVQRFRIIELLTGYPFMVARVQRFEDPAVATSEIEARLLQLKTRAQEILQLLPQVPAELGATLQNMNSAPALADFIAGLMELKPDEKQGVLDTLDVIARADKVLSFMSHQIEVLRISRDVDQQTKARFEDRQREVMLREQLKTIQQQLGEGEGSGAELAELAERIARAGMSEEAEKQARKELKRLESIPEASSEYSMVRTYLDWLIELPWSAATEDRIDIAEARRILDEDHYGLDKIKRRILEYLAVRKLNPSGKSPVLCFAGPPGVGKTSLGQSIAKATGRKFVRLSMGGVHDEAEIRGHRRTYVGALPGNVIQAIHKAGSNNCVMMLDEVDKLGASAHGDPAAALLEVLDPEQHDTFRDNYLGVPFDLSKVLFIATANVLDSIPGPLRDRMEVISLPGYTEEEKAQIARRYLVPRQLEANGLSAEQCEISDAAIHEVIAGYTREAGVRNLEREIGSVFRHAAMSVAEGTAQHVSVDAADLEAILGGRRFESEIAMRAGLPGVATGLAWTPVGGDILFIEASRTPGSGRLILTGQLGEVMRESVQAALTLLKGRAESLGIDPAQFERHDIHVHVPAGAIPKDGPSAGVAMFVALASLMTGKPVPASLAMTGEISLRGLVLPVGGIKEKVLAALRAGIKTVMLPARNRKDIDDIPEASRKQLEFVLLEQIEDALRVALPDAQAVRAGQAP
ncbi:Lon protease 2 [Pigmentiphaga humi]|uniref:Lon protease n=1 Tax=Pigmentiphaga humi TaxID=2478468 RepID=A0A3P4B746_9BURK|nr:endopeptidase La [Pigmentiphaga humi]VCU71508.1 Lon protease 2 [Pigmentiphaga humi]